MKSHEELYEESFHQSTSSTGLVKRFIPSQSRRRVDVCEQMCVDVL